ncbi:MAG TPA: type II secretion system protein [Candidatus Polarisedimenticolia bacterium]|nr:type II secretion system protein [Candidatus Polarisedimenticolia bacterium]
MRSRQQQGFSLLEILIVMGIMGIISAGILSQMDSAQQRGYSEQVKLDNFQEARDFVDQFFRDINQIGYPNSRMVDATQLTWSPALATQTSIGTGYTWASPYVNDRRLAIGLVAIGSNFVQFEGDMNGNGVVQTIVYKVNGSGSCILCLQRSEADKISADTLNGQNLNWGTEANDVITSPIFTYFRADGTQIPDASLPYNISTSTGATALASVKTIKISLTIRNNAVIDPKTNQPIETNFEGEVSINNCSMATIGSPQSCQ